MDIPVLVEQVENNGFRAISFAPAHFVAEGRTREEALNALQAQIRGRLASAEVVHLYVPLPGESHPWKSLAASWCNHPDAAEFEQNIQEYRQQVDADPHRL